MKAEKTLSQVIAHLQAARVDDEEISGLLTPAEIKIQDLIDAEPRYADTDAAYEQMVEAEMGCL